MENIGNNIGKKRIDDLVTLWRKELMGNSEIIEAFEERAAIREFDAGIARLEAERMAMEEVEKRRKSVDRDKGVNK